MRSPSRPRLVGGRCSCLRPSTRKSNSNMLRWFPIGREAADVLAPLRLAERGAMPVFGAKSKTPTSKETPPGTLDSAHVHADTNTCNGAGGGWWKEAKADVVVRKLLFI